MGTHRNHTYDAWGATGNPNQAEGKHIDRNRQPGNTTRADQTPDAHYSNPGRNADDPDMGAR